MAPYRRLPFELVDSEVNTFGLQGFESSLEAFALYPRL